MLLYEKVATEEGQSMRAWRRCLRRLDYPTHVHPEHELCLVLKGRGRRLVGETVEAFADGDLVLLGPMIPHAYFHAEGERRAGQGVEVILFQFTPQGLGLEAEAVPEWRRIEALLSAANRGLHFPKNTLGPVLRLLKQAVAAKGALRWLRLVEALELLAREEKARTLTRGGLGPRIAPTDRERISKVCRRMELEFDRDLPLTEVARETGLSPSAFSRFFRRCTRRSYRDFLVDLRLSHACKLLLETDWQIARIAYASGFNCLANFNRLFRKRRGQRPGEYRRSLPGA